MLSIGTRIQMHPATDCWMRGDRYGVIIGYGRTATSLYCAEKPYRVKLDKSGRVYRVGPDYVEATL